MLLILNVLVFYFNVMFSFLLGNNMSYDPAPLSKTAKYKKITKPLLERKRRARINRCLDELKDLMVGALEVRFFTTYICNVRLLKKCYLTLQKRSVGITAIKFF